MKFQARNYFKPFHFPWAYDYYKKSEAMHWGVEEVPLSNDIRDWKEKLSDNERSLLTDLFRFFTQADIDVAQGYHQHFLPAFKGIPELQMMMGSFANREAVHIDAYSKLIDTLGMPESTYKDFLSFKEMKAKHDYVNKFSSNSSHSLLMSLAAYSAFTEGLQLFGSFVILLNFSRNNKLKNMGNLIAWSIKDENCFKGDTEILTNAGWQRFDKLDRQSKVAQYHEDGEIEFVIPDNYIEKDGAHQFTKLHCDSFTIEATSEHDLLYVDSNTKIPQLKKHAINEFKPHFRRQLITAGQKLGGSKTQLTAKERFLIALQADGSLDYRIAEHGKFTNYKRAKFSLTKQRKKDRLVVILNELGWEWWSKDQEDGETHYSIKCDLDIEKTFSWVNLEEITSDWGNAFLKELMYWDGHDVHGDGSVIYYSSVVSENVDTVQAISCLSNKKITRGIQIDNRKESYNDVHRVWIYNDVIYQPTGRVEKSQFEYSGKVYCVSVPSGNIVVRQGNRIFVMGNCHVEGMTRLFREFAFHVYQQEGHPGLMKDLLPVAFKMVELEEHFIDLLFKGNGDPQSGKSGAAIEGLDPKDVKRYIHHLANQRWHQLGFNTDIYTVTGNPLPWVDFMVYGTEHQNFFEGKSTSYAKGLTKGTVDEIDW